jgi:hypothetical protein
MRSRVGQRVRIVSGVGPREAIGKTGTIVARERGEDGRVGLYRVELGDDGHVVWRGDWLRRLSDEPRVAPA